MRPKEIISLGIPRGLPLELAIGALREGARSGLKKGTLRKEIRALVSNPDLYLDHALFGALAGSLIQRGESLASFAPRQNHHNFAWKEHHFGEAVIVHRKGATPASLGTIGTIPGSMGTPGYVVRGRGHPESLESAAHGAGRKMSRKAASSRFTFEETRRHLKQQGVIILSAGADEVPMAYKDIDTVMTAQKDLVTPIARFDPKIGKMAP